MSEFELNPKWKTVKTLRSKNPKLASLIEKESAKRKVSVNTVILELLGVAMTEEKYSEKIESTISECNKRSIELQYLDVKTPFYFEDDEEKEVYKLLWHGGRDSINSNAYFYIENYRTGFRERLDFSTNFYKRVILK